MSLSEEITMLRKRVKEQLFQQQCLIHPDSSISIITFILADDFFHGIRQILILPGTVLGLAMETNMKADLCIHTLENALTAYPTLEGAVIHSDRGVICLVS